MKIQGTTSRRYSVIGTSSIAVKEYEKRLRRYRNAGITENLQDGYCVFDESIFPFVLKKIERDRFTLIGPTIENLKSMSQEELSIKLERLNSMFQLGNFLSFYNIEIDMTKVHCIDEAIQFILVSIYGDKAINQKEYKQNKIDAMNKFIAKIYGSTNQ